MKHLVRAGALLLSVLLLVFVVPRVMPIPAFLEEYGFHPEETEEDTEKWASLPIQFASSAVCLDCHQDKYNIWEQGNHRTISCENCHGPAQEHLKTGAPPTVTHKTRELCGLCHAKLVSRPSNFPQVDMEEMGGNAECITCHDPHDPRAGMPPQVPHTLKERTDCQSCHGPHEPFMPPPQVTHTLEGRTECLSCHGPQEVRGVTLPQIPHTLEGRTDCLTCHNTSGVKPFPEDHAGRTSATCLNCHRSK